MFDLSIVIVSWNAKEYVRQCLSSLRAATAGLSAEVIVVDNASSDGTPDVIEQEFPEVKLVRNSNNAGFAKGNNIGIRMASGKYVALINSDVTVPVGCLQKMVCYLDQHPAVGMLGPRMLTPSGFPGPSCMRKPSLGIWLTHALGLASFIPKLSLQIQHPESVGTEEVDVLNGWFWMVRKVALDQVGLLDERFFMYGEDIDWCHRFWERGWRLVYFADAEALHFGGASSARAPVLFYVEMQRANLQYWKRYHGRISQVAYFLIVFLHQVCRVLGYSVVYLLQPHARCEAAYKCERSAACLQWLLGADHSHTAEAR
jgi:GT2 family glycosyltransferase